MKRIFPCIGVVSILLLSCQSEDLTLIPNERKDISLTRSEVEMTALGNEFAFGFFKTVVDNEEKENVFVSPLSASIALSMAANGAAESTLEEMKTTLGFENYSLDEMNVYYEKLVDGLPAVDNTTTLGIANSIWIKEGFNVKQPFVDVNKDRYDAEVKYLDFNSRQAVDVINQWCSDQTNRRITNILDYIDPDARLFLINALYFKGVWAGKFDRRNTVPDDFTAASGQKKKVDMMRRECGTPYASDEGLRILELPYGNEAFSMIILLPDEDQSIDNIVDRLTSENWKRWLERLNNHTVDVKLPKFKMEYSRELINDLKELGMNIPFGIDADFSKMSDAGLFIGLVKQDAFVEVNEEGTEAAAVTVVGMFATSLPDGGKPQVIPFHVNRPFICIIKEKSTGAILFMGKVGNPLSN
ncbi:MAG: serpin family protein [Mediterranea sp.]|nr:serpin family protein [Mediterranea sp.]